MQNRSDGVFTLPSLRRRFDKCPNPAELSARRPCRPGGGGRLLIVLVLIVLVVLRVGVVRVGHERAAVVGTSVVGRSVVGRRAHRARGRSVCVPSKVCALKGNVAHRRDASICVSIISICVPHPDIHSRFIKFPIQRGGGARCRHGAMTVENQSTGDQGDCLLDDCLLDASPDDGGFPAADRRTDAEPARENGGMGACGPAGVESEAGDMAAGGLGSRTARAPGTGPSVPPPPQAPRQARRDSGSRWDTLNRHSGGEMLTMMFQSFTLTFQSHKFTFALKRDERLRPLSEEMRSPLACRPEAGRVGSE